jgi:hypothetical protein
VNRLALPLLLAVLLTLAVPASAQAAWSAPVTLSAPGGDAVYPQVAVDQNANAVFVWRRAAAGCCSRIQARARTAAGALSPIQGISPLYHDASAPQVAVDQSGNAVFAWHGELGGDECAYSPCLRIQARARSVDGTLSPVQTLSDAGQHAFDAHVAVDQNGNAVFVWVRSDGTTDCAGSTCYRIQARARSVDGTLSPVQTLSAPGHNAGLPRIAVDQNGNAVFSWLFNDGTTNSYYCNDAYGCKRVQARARTAAGALSAVQTLSAGGRDADYPNVATDENGNAVFAWSRYDETTDCIGDPDTQDPYPCRRVQARARSAAGALTATQTLTPAGRNAFSPQLEVDQDGDAVFVWLGNGVQARARSAAGALSAVKILAQPPISGASPQVAVDTDGNAVFVWARWDGTTDCSAYGCIRIEGRTRSAGGGLRPTRTLSAPGQNADFPQVAADPNGNAVAVWQRFDGANERIQAAAGP